MKATIGFLFFMLFLAGFAFVALQGRQMAANNPAGGGVGMTGVDWRPLTIAGEAMPEGSDMSVSFTEDGSINGNGGCNRFFGSLEQSDSGVNIGPLGATRRACEDAIMDREMAFLDALQNTRGFRTDNQTLELLGDDDAVLARLGR